MLWIVALLITNSLMFNIVDYIDSNSELQQTAPKFISSNNIRLYDSNGMKATRFNVDQSSSYILGSFNEKDCPVTVIMDKHFVSAYGNEDEARRQILAAMRNADQIFKREMNMGLPVVNIINLDPTSNLQETSSNLLDFHGKIQSHLREGSGDWKEWKKSCMVLYQTSQDFNGIIGYAGLKQRSNGGMCFGSLGLNLAVTTIKSRGMYLNPIKFYRNIAHELFHSAGSDHDGVDGISEDCQFSENPYIMRGSVSAGSNGDKLSPCSKRQIQENFKSGVDCLVPRNSVRYLQDL